MGPGDLEQVLSHLRVQVHPDLLVGLQTRDDAAVYRIAPDVAIVQTVDFFPPIVDDPYIFGAVAAANAMSDVYAMGGEVLFALNIAGFPEDLPREILFEIFRGGGDKVAEAGGVIAGGHTINDAEPKYGLAVTGTIRPDQVVTKAAARPGDILILTKALGSGVITTALKEQKAEKEHVAAAVESMLRLNRIGAAIMRELGIRTGTDITGFGLLGHAWEVAERSGVGLRLKLDAIPILPGALDYALGGYIPGGLRRNRKYLLAQGEGIALPADLPKEWLNLLCCPETSGGLFIAVPPDRLERLLSLFESREGRRPWVIGDVIEGRGIQVVGEINPHSIG